MTEAWELIADLKKQLGRQQNALAADLELAASADTDDPLIVGQQTRKAPLTSSDSSQERRMQEESERNSFSKRHGSCIRAPPSPTALEQVQARTVTDQVCLVACLVVCF